MFSERSEELSCAFARESLSLCVRCDSIGHVREGRMILCPGSMRNKSLDLEVAVETDDHHDRELDALRDPAASLSARHASALIALSVALEL